MKKLFSIIILFSLHVYPQKTFEVYNFTTQTVRLLDIVTNVSGVYPEFHSKANPVTIPPGGSYTLSNAADLTRFPFHSPSSSPYIPTWERLDPYIPPAAPVSTIMRSNNAWLMGSNQVFDRMGFSVGNSGNLINTTNTSTSPVTGPGYTAEYSVFIAPPLFTDIIYTIVIMP